MAKKIFNKGCVWVQPSILLNILFSYLFLGTEVQGDFHKGQGPVPVLH